MESLVKYWSLIDFKKGTPAKFGLGVTQLGRPGRLGRLVDLGKLGKPVHSFNFMISNYWVFFHRNIFVCFLTDRVSVCNVKCRCGEREFQCFQYGKSPLLVARLTLFKCI